MARRGRKLSHDQIVLAYTLLAGFPAVAATLVLLWTGDYEARDRWTFGLAVVLAWVAFSAAVHSRVVRPLQTMANLLSALREGDFSVRARGADRSEPLGDVLTEINVLSNTLQEQRISALEATALLRTVMEEIEVAIIAFDDAGTVRLANRAAQLLLGRPSERLVGRGAAELGLAECLSGDAARIFPAAFPGSLGPLSAGMMTRWGMRRSQFRQGGRPHQLLVIADLTRTLRDEELRAWQKLVRVLGHELNNSLAPIKSIAGSLATLVRRSPRPEDFEEDMRSGLEIIEGRADGLARFLEAYAGLARLPAPNPSAHSAVELARRAAALERRLAVDVRLETASGEGEGLLLRCDGPQIEQVLINLIKNATEAVLENASQTAPQVQVTVRRVPSAVEIAVDDNGPGIANPANLFVPFFTTKPAGSGIGLVLSRQIAENHGGTLALSNRAPGPGCSAVLTLPL